MIKNFKNRGFQVKNFFKKVTDWFKNHNIYSKDFYKTHKKLKRWLAVFFTAFVSAILIIAIVATTVFNVFLGKLDRGNLNTEELGISQEADKLYKDSGLINIMLYGIDSRSKTEISRSDAIMLLTIDKDNCKIKLTSIARDTYVDIEGYGKDKVNHAFAFGWQKEKDISGGAALSLKTINNAFDLNVTDYVTANFWAVATIIDYLGGVDIEIVESERWHINEIIKTMNEKGAPCEQLTKSGVQTLTGYQALAYSRERTVGGDVERGARQRRVITAMFAKAKTLSPVKYSGLVSLILEQCTTSLTNKEMLSLGTWAVANYSDIKIENLGLPTAEIDKGGQMINGVWYYVYDLDKATDIIKDFILEPDKTETEQTK